uniref:Uncharacterized protein n=1 Tax=Siphoviridae sp. cteHV32 TaxID=2825588 RepID=A0A8S5QGC7_9CAUD|nr:MAG TPA: hypothetical protein [Siphoviridae sp. cteHV32]
MIYSFCLRKHSNGLICNKYFIFSYYVLYCHVLSCNIPLYPAKLIRLNLYANSRCT